MAFRGLNPSKIKLITLLATNNIINVRTAFSNPITKASGVTIIKSIINNEEETLHPKYLCIIIAIISVPAVVPFPRITRPNATPTKTPAATPATTKFSGTNTGQSCVNLINNGNSNTATTVYIIVFFSK